jgi:cytochrome oxidase assembly protein ShyY1
VSRATRISLFAAAIFLVLVTAISGSYWLASWQISRSDRQWCDTITLLTSQPVVPPSDPASNPSRVVTYHLYEDFVTLRHQLGCR